MRALIATVAAVLLLAAVAFASGTSPLPVIAYVSWHTMTGTLFVTGPGGTHEVGNGQDPSVAPDGLMVSGSSYADSRRALTIYEMAGRRSHSFFSDRGFVTPLAWSPDSRYLAVLLGAYGAAGVPRIASAGLAVIDTATLTARTVATGVITGASFAPSGPDRLVYGYQTRSEQVKDPVMNLYTVNADGSDRTQLTTDGDSLQPLWTAKGIVYDREPRRGAGALPTYQLWLLHGGHSTQLTHIRTPTLVAELVSAGGVGQRQPADRRLRGAGRQPPVGGSAVAALGPRARHRRHNGAGRRDLTGRPDPAARARGMGAPASRWCRRDGPVRRRSADADCQRRLGCLERLTRLGSAI